MKSRMLVVAGLVVALLVGGAANAGGLAQATPAGSVRAVTLVGAWVDAGAPETETFAYVGVDDNTYEATFTADILPLFTQPNVWYPGAQACSTCHTADLESSAHELDLTSYTGILAGADRLEAPPGEPIIVPGDWNGSSLRGRLRNNRMPTGIEPTVARNGPDVTVDGTQVSVVDLIGAWVNAGAPESAAFVFQGKEGQQGSATFTSDVLPFFTEADAFFPGSIACSTCHTATLESSAHELDLTSYAGILAGADRLEEPPGEAIVVPGDWDASSLRGRLRNNRMPSGISASVERDGPIVLHGQAIAAAAPQPSQLVTGEGEVKAVELIGAWVSGGAPEAEAFTFTGADGNSYQATFSTDVLPLFTTPNVWYAGALACSTCHTATLESSAHELDLTSYEGILAGADRLEAPPGEPILVPGDWNASSLRGRLRNNRMPSGITPSVARNGPDVTVNGGTISTVDLIGAWVDAGAPDTSAFDFTGSDGLTYAATFAENILPLFTGANTFFEGSVSCATCHTAALETSAHELDLTSYEGILAGADRLEEPPGEAIVVSGDWSGSSLRGRLRNNRMPSGIPASVDRDGPVVKAGTLTVAPTAEPTATLAPSPTAVPPTPSGGQTGRTVGLFLGILVIVGIAYAVLRRSRK